MLSQLAEEYRATADCIQARLSTLQTQVKTTYGNEGNKMQWRIEMLYKELVDLRSIMAYLKNYYED